MRCGSCRNFIFFGGEGHVGSDDGRIDMTKQADTYAEHRSRLMRICRELLEVVDPQPDRPDLQETPRRFADFWMEFLHAPRGNVTSFQSVTADQMVVVSGMRVWSMCEHHLLPFWCDISVGYITQERVLGLSKFARIAHAVAGRPQVQERIVEEIAQRIVDAAGSNDVAVLARGEHLCMTMRGIKTPALMTSSAMRGAFRDSAAVRAEFMSLALHSPR